MTPPSKQGFWQPSNWYLAQVVHVLASLAIVEGCLLHFHTPLLPLCILIAGIAGFKEYAIDCSPFENDSIWGSTQDWFCYLLGVAVAATAQADVWLGIALAASVVGCLFAIDAIAQKSAKNIDE